MSEPDLSSAAPTTRDTSAASAAPRRTPGARTRAGNNMTRARAGILNGAAACLARYGSRKTTMADIAREGGVAKATLYNHFRTKPDVYSALVATEVEGLLERLAATSAPAGSADAVAEVAARAATWLSQHKAVRQLSRNEPELLARLVVPGKTALWKSVRKATLHHVTLAQAAGAVHPQHEADRLADALLRWVLSHAQWPTTEPEIKAGAHLLVRGMLAPPPAQSVAVQETLPTEGAEASA